MTVSIEIFRPGTHRDMSGRQIVFGEADLAAVAAGYDPTRHEAPVCVGHPEHDAPAYAWVSGLRFADGALIADVDQIDPEFAELVREGRYKKVSAAFYRPGGPNNPTPSGHYLRHIGFLGAQPPAVKGLKQAAFADGDDALVFADWDQLDLVSVLRGLRDFLIEKFGAEDADRALPPAVLDRLQNSAAQPDPAPEPSFAEAAGPERAALERERAALAAERTAFAEERARARRGEDAAFLDDLVRSGWLTPASRDGAAAFMEVLAGGDTAAFGEAGASARDWFKAYARGLSPSVVFGEVATPRDLSAAAGGAGYRPPPGYAVDPARAEIHGEALAYQETHGGVDYITAVKAVENDGRG